MGLALKFISYFPVCFARGLPATLIKLMSFRFYNFHTSSPFFAPDHETLLRPGAKKDGCFRRLEKQEKKKTDIENSKKRLAFSDSLWTCIHIAYYIFVMLKVYRSRWIDRYKQISTASHLFLVLYSFNAVNWEIDILYHQSTLNRNKPTRQCSPFFVLLFFCSA